MRETLRTLCLYCDLSDDARENAFSRYDNEEDARWYLDMEFEDIRASREWFEKQTGTSFIRFFDYGEYWYPSPLVDVYNGWGVMREFVAIDENAWSIWCDYDAMVAWNRHASRFAYLYQRCSELAYEDNVPTEYATPNPYAHGYDWYAEKYQEELEKAISDVCDALNADWRASQDYTETREFYEDELERDDSEHWFTSDGMREYIRDSTVRVGDLENVDDPDNYVEIIYECRNPYRLFVREYSDE